MISRKPIIQDLFENTITVSNLGRIVEKIGRRCPKLVFLNDSLESVCSGVVIEKAARRYLFRRDKLSIKVKL